MRIVVAYKWAANPADATVTPDGVIDWSRAKAGLSEYDPVAIEVGRGLADATGSELVGLTVGTPSAGSTLARKAALSRGLDRLVVVTGEDIDLLDVSRTAALLAAAVRRMGGVDLVVTGGSSVDVAANIVPALLGGRLGWPVLNDVGQVRADGDAVLVTRSLPTGEQELRCATPAVLSVATDAATARVPGMKDILAAGKRPVDDLGVESLDVVAAHPEVIGRSRPHLTARKGRRIDAADPDAAARQLVDALRADGVL